MNHVDNTYNTQAVLSLCPGILGLEKGIERAIRTLRGNGAISETDHERPAIRVVAYVEIEAFIITNLVGQMEAGLLAPAPIWSNVKTFDALPFRDRVHGIIGGYPCQPFSHAGERKGTEDPRHLWPYILEQIKIIGPEWVYFENVAGHLTLGYEEVRRSLSGIGYRVEEGIFTAEEVGAPHRRERIFILATMENADILRWGRGIDGPELRGKRENKVTGSSPSMEDTYCQPIGHRPGKIGRKPGKSNVRQGNGEVGTNRIATTNIDVDDTDCQCKHRCASTCGKWKSESTISSIGESIDIGGELANSRQSRLAGWEKQYARSECQTIKRSCGIEFPAGQGTYQHEWEEPRTIESGLVYTIDGYNFTEDLHRAIGNSVVEQTAELAFISLLNKHLKNTYL